MSGPTQKLSMFHVISFSLMKFLDSQILIRTKLGPVTLYNTGDSSDAKHSIVMMVSFPPRQDLNFFKPELSAPISINWNPASVRSGVYIITIFDDWSNLIHQKGKDHFLDFPFMVSSNFFVASLIIEMTIGTFNFHTSWLISFELEPCKIRA